MVWWGARNGRSDSRPAPAGSRPATEWTAVAASASSKVGGGNGEHPTRRVDRAVERELAEQDQVRDMATLDNARRGKDSQRNRQVEGRTRLADVRGREVDGDLVRRELEAGVAYRAFDAIAALAHAGIGQADHRERGQTERHVDFDVHRTRLHAEDGGRTQRGEHARTLCKSRCVARDRVFSTGWRNHDLRKSQELPRGRLRGTQRWVRSAALSCQLSALRRPKPESWSC